MCKKRDRPAGPLTPLLQNGIVEVWHVCFVFGLMWLAKVCEGDAKMDDLSRKVIAIDEKLDGFMEKVLNALGAK